MGTNMSEKTEDNGEISPFSVAVIESVIEILKCVSIRGRMAYLICSFEELLQYYKCRKEEWGWILEKLWSYTKIQYLDDWMYELAEYMPNSILEDTSLEDAEYITENRFNGLHKLYNNANKEILHFIMLIYECGTCELYSKLCGRSAGTLEKVAKAIDILERHKIDVIDITPFKIYSFDECDGWGSRFEGKTLSKMIRT